MAALSERPRGVLSGLAQHTAVELFWLLEESGFDLDLAAAAAEAANTQRLLKAELQALLASSDFEQQPDKEYLVRTTSAGTRTMAELEMLLDQTAVAGGEMHRPLGAPPLGQGPELSEAQSLLAAEKRAHAATKKNLRDMTAQLTAPCETAKEAEAVAQNGKREAESALEQLRGDMTALRATNEELVLANPAPIPLSPVFGRTLGSSSFKASYSDVTAPEGPMDLGVALGDLLKGYCRKHSIKSKWKEEDQPFLKLLQQEALQNMDDPIAEMTQRMWTSFLPLQGKEFCFILNDAVSALR